MDKPNSYSHQNDNPHKNGPDHQRAHAWEVERQRIQREERMEMWAQATRPQPTQPSSGGGSTNGCFAAGTAILVPEGTRPIESIRTGDVVLAKAEGSTRVVPEKVTRIRTVAKATIWHVTLRGQTSPVATTANHRFLTNRGWIATRKLRPGDHVTMASGASVAVGSVENTRTSATVFNLIVSREFTYIADGCVVHSFGLLRSSRVAWWRLVGRIGAYRSRLGSVPLRAARSAALLALTVCAPVTLAGCDVETMRRLGAAASEASPVISDLNAEHDTRLVNNEWDYGLNITFTMTNKGKDGLVRVTPWMSCSEGEWSREQTVKIDAGQSLKLTYFIQEPSINSTNIQYGVRTSP